MKPEKQTGDYDCIVVGAGHNGLTAAAYLARSGKRVLVLERAEVVGGACISEEIHPGFRASVASYVVSLLDAGIIRDLQLHRHGYEVLSREPSSFTPWTDGSSLLLSADASENLREISRLSRRDAQAWPRYEAWLTRTAERLEPIISAEPVDLMPWRREWRKRGLVQTFRQWRGATRLRRQLADFGDDLPELMPLMLGGARQMLDRWFESPVLKATLATDAVIGTFLPPSAPGTAYVLLHHVMGDAGGARGVWAYARGGMGSISKALWRAAQEAGASLQCRAEVAAITPLGAGGFSVRLADGRELKAASVLSNATPEVTFERLLAAESLPDGFKRAVAAIDYASASVKINVALSSLPDFSALRPQADPESLCRGTLHIGPDMDGMERAWAEAMSGHSSASPIIEMTLPSTVDNSLAPAGQHIAQLFVQYAPYALKQQSWDEHRQHFAQRCFKAIDQYAPNFSRSVLHAQVLAPPDLERRFGLTGGNIFHGAMHPHQIYSNRPVPGWADGRCPIKGLYLCGAGAHPGGGVTGLPGRNAAMAALADL